MQCSWWQVVRSFIYCVVIGGTVWLLCSYIGLPCGPCSPCTAAEPIQHAVAVVHPLRNSGVHGVVTFTRLEDGGGVRVVADIHGLTPGLHGFHIHVHGDVRCNDGMCTGDHFNPTHMRHGDRTGSERHAGDFGNLEADAAGDAHLDFVDPQLELNGAHSIIGRAVIVHADRDDLVSQPSGNAGARIGCGVIGIAARASS